MVYRSTTDNYLLQHIAVELGFSKIVNNDNICESFGHMSDIDSYINALNLFLNNVFKKHNELNAEVSNIFSELNIDPFMKRTVIHFNISVDINKLDVEPMSIVDGDYQLKKFKGVYFPYISINGAANSVEGLIKDVASNVAHELLHAYEELNRRVKKVNTLQDIIDRDNLNKISVHLTGNAEVSYATKMAVVLDRLHDVEQRALISQIYTELQNTEERITDAYSGLNALKETNIYKKVMLVASYVDELTSKKFADDENMRHQRVVVMRVWNERFGKNASDYSVIAKRLREMFDRFYKTFIKKAASCIYEIYEKNMFSESHVMIRKNPLSYKIFWL